MTSTATAYTDRSDSAAAGHDLANQIQTVLGPEPIDAAVVFAASDFDYRSLLTAFDRTCRPKILVGSSSAGEFTEQRRGEGTASALGIRSADLVLAAGLGLNVSDDRAGAARDVVAAFRGLQSREFPYRSALIMTDALAGHADDLVDHLTALTAGQYQFAGGGAGDNAKFARTHVFYGTEPVTNAVVGLEILSSKPIGIGVGHGWTPASRPLRVTDTDGMRVISLNGMPAVEAFEEHARTTGQSFDRNAPLPFFLHHILGIDTGAGHRLRVPLSVNPDGSVTCAAELPINGLVHIMRATSESAVTAARNATDLAVAGLRGHQPGAALFFDCVATRLRMGDAFGLELQSVGERLGGSGFVGCNTYGQIARAEGQFSGFHNCTAVVMVLPA